MGRSWYDHDWTTPAEIELLAARGRLREGARVLDVGAHQGVVAMMLADLVGEAGQVVAVEATPHNAELAVRNAAMNGLTRIEVLHAAGADTPGVLHFSPRMNGHVAAADEASVAVRAVTVDELAAAFGPPQVLFVEVHMGVGLERFGDAEDLLRLIPPGYEILVSRTEHGPYRPLAEARDELRHHSRLVALAGVTARGASAV
jgi:FkbM family methyltransferase